MPKIVSSPRVFIDPRTGALNGLNNGGSHGKDATKPKSLRTPTSATTSRCIRRIGLAAGACSGNGILLDIKDPVHPKRVDAVNDPNYSYWHSASFSNDGTKGRLHRRVGRRPRRALPSERSEQVGRGRHLPSCRRQADLRQLLQAARRAGRHRKLRRAQRLARSDPRPRYRSPGLVSGRHLGDGFHRPRAPV